MNYYIYILTNSNHTVLYIGVTNNLERRLFEHRNESVDGFSKRYHLHKLIYYESTSDIMSALEREKQLKRWTRKKKNDLIATMNSEWKDLSEE